jgi:hypothetical protein
MNEEWKKCFETYEISNFGNCRRKLKNGLYKTVNGCINNRGYKYLQINRGGKRTNFLFHHFVATQFIGERVNGLVIDHIDRNKLNNKVDNLRYITQNENMRNTDKYKNEVEEKDSKLRNIIVTKMLHIDNVNNKRFICDICPRISNVSGIFQNNYSLTRHYNSKNHKKRCHIINEMKKCDIPVNHTEFKKLRYKVEDYKSGKLKKKPNILW